MNASRACPCKRRDSMLPGWTHAVCKGCGWEWHVNDVPYPRGFVCPGCAKENEKAQLDEIARWNQRGGFEMQTEPIDIAPAHEARDDQ